MQIGMNAFWPSPGSAAFHDIIRGGTARNLGLNEPASIG
jgi:hypothetical protein